MDNFTGIVILNYRNYNLTIDCIESVMKYNTSPVKFIVIDNGSDNESVKILDDFFSRQFRTKYRRLKPDDSLVGELPEMTLIENSKNEGYARGNNLGLELANHDESIQYILVINSDILFVMDIIPTLISGFENPDVGIVSPLLLKKDGLNVDYNCCRRMLTPYEMLYRHLSNIHLDIFKKSVRISDTHILKNMPQPYANYITMDMPSGSCMMFKKSFFKEIKFFDPNTFLYYEEAILYKKVQSKSKCCLLDTSVKCIHLGGGSTDENMPVSRFGIESQLHYIKHYGNVSRVFFIAYSCIAWLSFLKSQLYVRKRLKSLKRLVRCR